MTTILRNDDAEALILDIRTGHNALAQRLDDRPGAFLVFPTSIVTACPGGGQSVYPLTIDVEPGLLVGDPGAASVSAVVDGVAVSGIYSWRHVDGGPAIAIEPAGYRFERRGRAVAAPSWADQLPKSRCLVRQTPQMLAREQARLVRRGRAAEHWLLTLTDRVVRQSCRGPIRLAIHHRPLVDVDDVVQRALQTACRLLPIYASAKRPPCSWLGMLRLDGQRDMNREISRLDWLPAGRGRARSADATLAPGETSTPTSLDSLQPSFVEAALARVPPELDAIDNRAGAAAAAVARLVGSDAEIVAQVAQGDVVALGRVSRLVVGALAGDGESQSGTRRRCWAEFQDTGQLFATDVGRSRFAGLAAPAVLAAIDASLCEAAGIRGRSGDSW